MADFQAVMASHQNVLPVLHCPRIGEGTLRIFFTLGSSVFGAVTLFPCWNAPFSATLQQRHEGTGVVINVHILSDPSVIVRELATELEPEILHGVGISIKNQTNGTYT